jgi:hypothetical protein
MGSVGRGLIRLVCAVDADGNEVAHPTAVDRGAARHPCCVERLLGATLPATAMARSSGSPDPNGSATAPARPILLRPKPDRAATPAGNGGASTRILDFRGSAQRRGISGHRLFSRIYVKPPTKSVRALALIKLAERAPHRVGVIERVPSARCLFAAGARFTEPSSSKQPRRS